MRKMKKNLLSVLILALLIVNLVLTSVMMVSVIGTNSKTAALITSITKVLNLELYEPGEDPDANVPLSQTATYSLADRLMVQLKQDVGPDGSKQGAGMIIFYMSLSMNTEHEDYAKLGTSETLSGFEIQIKDAVASVLQNYTEQDCRENGDRIRGEILLAIQNLFQSDFIYKVSISDVIYQ